MHPDESLLLAYIRHQPCEYGEEPIQQHIQSCSLCQARCAEYEQIGKALENWSHTYPYRAYPSLTEQVMQRAQGQSVHMRSRGRFSWRVLSLPVALALLILSVVIALAHLSSSTAINPTPTIGQSTPIQYQTVLPPRVTVGTTPTAPAGIVPTPTGPTLVQCSNSDDNAHARIRVCGSNFTPRSQVYLILHLPNGDVKRLKTIQVGGKGMFEFVFTISRCKDVPLEVIAQSETNPAEQSQPLSHLDYTCVNAQ